MHCKALRRGKMRTGGFCDRLQGARNAHREKHTCIFHRAAILPKNRALRQFPRPAQIAQGCNEIFMQRQQSPQSSFRNVWRCRATTNRA